MTKTGGEKCLHYTDIPHFDAAYMVNTCGGSSAAAVFSSFFHVNGVIYCLSVRASGERCGCAEGTMIIRGGMEMSAFGKALFGAALIGAAAAGVYYYLEKTSRESAEEGEENGGAFDPENVKKAANRAYTTIKHGTDQTWSKVKDAITPRNDEADDDEDIDIEVEGNEDETAAEKVPEEAAAAAVNTPEEAAAAEEKTPEDTAAAEAPSETEESAAEAADATVENADSPADDTAPAEDGKQQDEEEPADAQQSEDASEDTEFVRKAEEVEKFFDDTDSSR